MEQPSGSSDLRIKFTDTKKHPERSIVAARDIIRSRQSVFQAAAELPAENDEVVCEATTSRNCKALQGYFEYVFE